MPLSIRSPNASDASRIADLHVSTWREAYAHLLTEDFFTDEYIRARHEMWTGILTSPREEWTIRVAEFDDELVGFGFSGPSVVPDGDPPPPRDTQLYMIYVAAAHYGTGAGQALFDAVLADVPAVLWVAKDNPRAVAFYIRNGFVFDGSEQIDPGAPRIIDARMVR